MTLPEAQRMTGHDGYDDISVAAAAARRRRSSRRRSPRSSAREFAVRTGKEQADKQAQDLSDALGFIRTALLVFAGVALLVGGFLIFNTFAVTVAQRAREFALLRTLGASRGQVLRSVLAETLVIGVLASVVGILGGLAARAGAGARCWRRSGSTSDTGTVLEPRTIIAGLVVGIVALVSGLVPARRATRSSRSRRCGRRRARRRRTPPAADRRPLASGARRGAAALGLFGDPGAAARGVRARRRRRADDLRLRAAGASLVRPLARGRQAARARPGPHGPARARERARQPQRTAVTASALMIGVALVVLVAIFAAGLRATIDQGIDNQVRAAEHRHPRGRLLAAAGGVVERWSRSTA